jgi:N-acetyl-anhydromuramyl-L-alanine amidase AmpD
MSVELNWVLQRINKVDDLYVWKVQTFADDGSIDSFCCTYAYASETSAMLQARYLATENIRCSVYHEIAATYNIEKGETMEFNKPNRNITEVFLHCSATDNPDHDDVEVIRKWHTDKGWSDIGYHFFIRKDGTVDVGRDLEKIPAAQKGHNTNSIAICCHGLLVENFTEVQMDALVKLCQNIDDAYSYITFHGHCEVSNKTCPVFDYKDILGLDDKGYMS